MKELKTMSYTSAVISLMFIATGVYIGMKYQEKKDKKA